MLSTLSFILGFVTAQLVKSTDLSNLKSCYIVLYKGYSLLDVMRAWIHLCFGYIYILKNESSFSCFPRANCKTADIPGASKMCFLLPCHSLYELNRNRGTGKNSKKIIKKKSIGKVYREETRNRKSQVKRSTSVCGQAI